MTQQGHDRLLNLIDGEWAESESHQVIGNINPADARVRLGEVVDSTAQDTLRAIDAAKRAFTSWRKVPAPKRGDMVLEAMRILLQRKEAIARAMTLEEGKTYAESLGEVAKSAHVLEFMAGEALRLNGSTMPSEMPRNFAYTVRSPLGVVGLITPWNFPICIPAWKIAPALIAGNTVVFKPSPLTPWTAKMIVEIFQEAGVPPGVLNLVHGGVEVGQTIVEHPDVRALSFTGSNAVGTKLYEAGARLLKKVQCEMGGKNPVIVLEDADLDLAATATVQGAFGSTGQRCTATSRAIVIDEVADAFIERVYALAQRLKVGPGLAPGTEVGPSVSEAQMSKVLAYHAIAKDEGHRRVLGGERVLDGDLAHGFFTAPTIYDRVSAGSRIGQEEIFGPVLSIIRVKDWPHAIEAANSVAYGLSSSVFTRDIGRCMEYVDEIETGMLHVNSPTVGGEAQLPFGGVKATGVGQREMGPTAIDFFSEWKTVYIDYTGQKRESKIY
ncbi:MAG: aldehyde dehydrogenase family protein [Deltaproteobacteria bacterium]|nr:aldehyde dehydrogenase family protein [Deltaproteobacteria bacterium]